MAVYPMPEDIDLTLAQLKNATEEIATLKAELREAEELLRRADELISDAQCAYGEGCEDEQWREDYADYLDRTASAEGREQC